MERMQASPLKAVTCFSEEHEEDAVDGEQEEDDDDTDGASDSSKLPLSLLA